MPNIKSVIKDVKKSRERRLRNVDAKSKIKTFVKKSRAAMDEQSGEVAALVSETVSIIDRTAKRGSVNGRADRRCRDGGEGASIGSVGRASIVRS